MDKPQRTNGQDNGHGHLYLDMDTSICPNWHSNVLYLNKWTKPQNLNE
jgi:hypothetical protein